MNERFAPSALSGALVPAFVRARFLEPISKMETAADRIWRGEDENALSMRTALTAFSIRIVSALIAYISQILIARWIGTYEYGIFVWVWVLVVICGGLSSLGFPSAVVRFIPEYQVRNDVSKLRGVIFGSRVFTIVIATLIAASGVAIVSWFDNLVSNVYLMPLFLAAICLPMLALTDVQDGIARAHNWVVLALAPTFLIRPVLILAAMAVALAMGYPATAATALIASIVATWATTVAQLLIMNRRLRKSLPSGPREITLKTWLVVSLPIFLVEGFFGLLTNVDILIAGVYLPPEDVAIYFAAVKTLALVHFVYFAVKAASAHRFSRYFATEDKSQLRAYVRKTVYWTFWPSVVMGILMIGAGKFLLGLFGPEFSQAYPLLLILVVGIIARASVGPAESVLNMMGEQKVCALVYGATLAVNVTLNFSLIPLYGLYGAATATTIALIFETLALYSMILRRLQIPMFILSTSGSPNLKAG